MKALVLGATGATGNDLVQQLLKDQTFNKVDIFVRKPVDFKHEKLTVHVIDFDKTDGWQGLVKGDVLFSCLGTTLKAAGSKDAQWKVDYEYQYQFAQAAKANGVEFYALVSSSGATPNSRIFYLQMKGKLEDKIIQLEFKTTVIFQPGPLERKNTDRPAERLSISVIKFFNKLGLLKSQTPIATFKLAKAMIATVKIPYIGLHKLKTNIIVNLSQH